MLLCAAAHRQYFSRLITGFACLPGSNQQHLCSDADSPSGAAETFQFLIGPSLLALYPIYLPGAAADLAGRSVRPRAFLPLRPGAQP